MKLTLLEVEILFNELNGKIVDSKTRQREGGLFSHKLPIRVKYILQNELNSKLKKELESMEQEVIGAFKELGEQIGDEYVVSDLNREELSIRLNEINSIEVDVPVPDIDLEEILNIETSEYWSILLDKLLKKE